MSGILLQLVVAWFLAAAFMSVLWLVQRRTGNAGVVDAGWAASIGTLAAAVAAVGQGGLPYRCAAGVMGLLWGWRLAIHIHRRSHGRPEDGRYQQLRREWGANVQARMFRFYQMQAVTVAFFLLPFALLAAAPSGTSLVVLGIGAAVWAAGFLGETIADHQLEAFRRDSRSAGRVCRIGLWSLSRHPNYFFEWLTWCGIALAASAAPSGLLAWLCPAAILGLLWRVTGIPATEAQAVRSKGDAYRDYQRCTNAFFPWFPRKDRRTHESSA